MKPIVTIKRILAAASVAICMTAFNACIKEDVSENPPVEEVGKLVEMTFVASQMEVKSTFAENKVNLEVGDKVAIYDGTARREFSVVSADGGAATLSGLVAEGATEFHAVYPYSASSEALPSEGKVNVALPSEQTLASGKNFDEDAFVMVGKAVDNHISFKNVVSLLKLNIPEGVTSVSVKGYASEGIAGAAAVTVAETPAVSASEEASASIVLRPAGESFTAGAHYIALLPSTFANGFKVVYEKDGKMAVKKNVTANVVFPMNGGNDITAYTTADADFKWLANPIMTEADLLAYVADQDAYAGETAKIGADITLTEQWAPVKLTGTLDGQGYTISGLNVSVSAVTQAGMFTEIAADAALRNVTVEGSINLTSGRNGVPAGLAAYLLGTMDKVINKVSVSAESSGGRAYVGGLVGYLKGGNLTACENYGDITLNYTKGKGQVGGIVGVIYPTGLVDKCINYGKITSSSAASNMEGLGGVVGCQQGGDVKGCFNKGTLVVDGAYAKGSYVGGVTGWLNNYESKAIATSQCSNEGQININTELVAVGGVVGYLLDGAGSVPSAAEISGCENKVNINVSIDKTYTSYESGKYGPDGFYLGGIVGCVMAASSSQIVNAVKNCTNSGDLSATSESGADNSIKIGGICGSARGPVVVEGNVNSAKTVSVSVTAAKDDYCSAGGIVGEAGDRGNNETAAITLKANENHASVLSKTNTVKTPAGGLIGYAFCPVTSSGNKNSGDVERNVIDGVDEPDTQYCFAGGLVGLFHMSTDSATPYLQAYFTNDQTVGDIKSNGRAGIFFGGMTEDSYADFSFDSCRFEGRLTSPHSDYDLEMDADNWNDKNSVADGGYLWGYLQSGQYTFTTYTPIFGAASN